MLVLSKSDLESLVSQDETIAALRDVLARQGVDADTRAPNPLRLEQDDGIHLPLAGVDAGSGLATVKLLTDRPTNADHDLPTQMSAIQVIDRRTGRLEAVLHGAVPTRARTAGTTAVATDLLACPDAEVLGLVGAGPLAVEHVDAVSRVRKLREVHVWSRTKTSVERFRRAVDARFAALGVGAPEIVTANEVRDVLAAQILCTVTPSVSPPVRGAWLTPGQHVNAIGARPRPDQRELDTAAMHAGRVFVDHRETVSRESGDHLLARHPETGDLPAIIGDLGELLRGEVRGRSSADEVTIFNSVGTGLQDTAIAAILLAKARERGVGTEVTFHD